MKLPALNLVKSIIRLPRIRKRDRPFKYSVKGIAVFFCAVVLKGILVLKECIILDKYLLFVKASGFKEDIPDRTTLSRRFKSCWLKRIKYLLTDKGDDDKN